MEQTVLRSIASSYGARSNRADFFEKGFKKVKEKILGIDYSVFDKTICYYEEVKGIKVTQEEALGRALNKEAHKQAWFAKERKSLEDISHFYQEEDTYIFRQPFVRRFGGYRWYMNLVNHIERPLILEYGCGSAVLTEYLAERFPDAEYHVADIPSTTLDFILWKKQTYNLPYTILPIGLGKEGIPLQRRYDMIICEGVLEHTPNPLDIVVSFCDHLSSDGVLVVDFINDSGGENLEEAAQQRESVKAYLKTHLLPLKAIDEPSGYNGLYVKANDGSLRI